MIYVAFTDSTQAQIAAVFTCPQSWEYFPFQGTVEAGDERLKGFPTSVSES